jgi:hypothetical protein
MEVAKASDDAIVGSILAETKKKMTKIENQNQPILA